MATLKSGKKSSVAKERPIPAERNMWHAMSADDVASALATQVLLGLTREEAENRVARYGLNELPAPKPKPAWRRFLGQFHNVLIYVLLAASTGAFALGDAIDGSVILGVVAINAVIGYMQEDKAEAALNAIRNLLGLTTTVIRSGGRSVISAEALVPGDVVFLQAGDKVPADIRLVEAKSLALDESALTGESGAVFKSVDAINAETVLAERRNIAYSGTLIVKGQGLGVVVETGGRTELGRISALLSQVGVLDTPLQKQLTTFGHWLTGIILSMSMAVFAFGFWVRGETLHEMFMAMVAIAVAAIPEGLPAIVTITLAIGVQRMARRAAIVRHLPSVETLGEVTVICSDKTGTLTANQMTVRTLVLASENSGEQGSSTVDNLFERGERAPELLALIRSAVLCNDAEVRLENELPRQDGDPTEAALLLMGLKFNLSKQDQSASWPRMDCIPFESEHRFMATLHHGPDEEGLICMKGAPEAVISRCTQQMVAGELRPLDHEFWDRQAEAMAKNGERLIAIAQKQVPVPSPALSRDSVQDGFVLLGVCGLVDPPREEVVAAIHDCQLAHIRVKMITGDHGMTAQAIGRQLGIGGSELPALLGGEIDAMSDEQLVAKVALHDVFARTSPEHKLRLVRALQSQGEVVAMTGDGVNDAPALKAANVGIAMGMRGSEVAKDAAVMVLTDDNFASIAHAVEEGRTIHDNLLKAIVFVLPTSFAQAGAVVIGPLLGINLPITPLQILWVNLVTAVTLSIALAFEPPEDQVMRRRPRPPGAPLLGWFSLWRIVFVTLLLVAGLMGLYLYEIEHGGDVVLSRTAAVNALIVGEIFYLFNSRYIHSSSLTWGGLFSNRYAWLASGVLLFLQGLMTYVPLFQRWFGTAALDLESWARIVAFGALVFVVVELEKLLLRMFRGKREESGDGQPSSMATAPNAGRGNLTRFAMLSIAAAVVTIGLKATAYYLTGSVGLLSDAMESVVNLVAAMMALAMLMIAAKPPDEEHHYGHGKAEYFSSGLEGSLIIVAAVGIAVAASDRIAHPQPISRLDIGLLISVVASLINFWVAMVLMRVGRRYGSITLEADAHHLLTDVWTSVGVVVGLGAVYVTGWQMLDPLIAIAVALNIIWSGVVLIKRSIAGLLDATLPAEENETIAKVLEAYRQQGIEFHDLRTRQSGTHRFMTVHILVPGSMTIQAGHDLAERIEREIAEAVGEITVVTHLEPLEDPASFNHIKHVE